MRADHAVIAVATPIGAATLYFLLAGEVSGSEAIACAPVVLVSTIYAFALARSGTVELRMRVRNVLSLLRRCLAVLPDCWRVGRGLVKAEQGAITHLPFRIGGAGGDDAGRRAAVIAGLSLAPNGFVVGQEDEALIIHQLAPAPFRGDREWPI